MKPSDLRPPSQGEQAAILGYDAQYTLAASRALIACRMPGFESLKLLNPNAGKADDFVLEFSHRVEAVQVKWHAVPQSIPRSELLPILCDLIKARSELVAQFADREIAVTLVSNGYPSNSDSIKGGKEESLGTSASFVQAIRQEISPESSSNVSLAEYWGPVVKGIAESAGMDETAAHEHLHSLRLQFGERLPCEALSAYDPSPAVNLQAVRQLKSELFERVRLSGSGETVVLSRVEILAIAGVERQSRINKHVFPRPQVGYSKLGNTARDLSQRVRCIDRGYLALVGGPGAGKSTLLQEETLEENSITLRYFAYIPGANTSAASRGESDSFHRDLLAQFRMAGAKPHGGASTQESSLQDELFKYLNWASEQFERHGRKTLIIIDGLDHVPRELRPSRSFLQDLPLPDQVPVGVIFVLGTQQPALSELPPAVRRHLTADERIVTCRGLTETEVSDLLRSGALASIATDRMSESLFEWSEGHPLSVTVAIKRALDLRSDSEEAFLKLLGGLEVLGPDVESHYQTVLERLDPNDGVLDFLGKAARDRLPFADSRASTVISQKELRNLMKHTGHLWNIDPAGRKYPFHNSFRLFLLRITSVDSRFGTEQQASEHYHRELAQYYASSESAGERWESIYHYIAAGDIQEALLRTTLDNARGYIRETAAPWRVVADATGLCLIALKTGNITKAAELTLVRCEAHYAELQLDPHIESIALRFARLGLSVPCVDLLTDGSSLRCDRSTAMQVSLELLNNGYRDEANRLFKLSEPTDLLSGARCQEPIAGRMDLLSWVSVAHNFIPHEAVFETLLRYDPPSEDPFDQIPQKDELIERLCFALARSESEGELSLALLQGFDHLAETSFSHWRKAAINFLSSRGALSGDHCDFTKWILDQVLNLDLDDCPDFLRLRLARSVHNLDGYEEVALQIIAESSPPPIDQDPIGNQIGAYCEYWFEFSRLRKELGTPLDYREIPILEKSDFQTLRATLARHFAKLGSHIGLTPCLESEPLVSWLDSVLRFLDGFGSTNRVRWEAHRLRPAVAGEFLRHSYGISRMADAIQRFESRMNSAKREDFPDVQELRDWRSVFAKSCRTSTERKLVAGILMEHLKEGPVAFASERVEDTMLLCDLAISDREPLSAVEWLYEAAGATGTIEGEHDPRAGDLIEFLSKAVQRIPDKERGLQAASSALRCVTSLPLTNADCDHPCKYFLQLAVRTDRASGKTLVHLLSETQCLSMPEALGGWLAAASSAVPELKPLAWAIASELVIPACFPEGLNLAELIPEPRGADLTKEYFQIHSSTSGTARERWQDAFIDTLSPEARALLFKSLDSFREFHPDLPEAKRSELSDGSEFSDLAAFAQTEGGEPRYERIADLRHAISVVSDQVLSELAENQEDSLSLEGLERDLLVELANRGQNRQKEKLAEYFMDSQTGDYSRDWTSQGRRCIALEAIADIKPIAESARIGVDALVKSLEGDRFSVTPGASELFPSLFGVVVEGSTLEEIVGLVGNHLEFAARYSGKAERVEHANKSLREQFLELIEDCLRSPAIFIAEGAQRAIARLAREGLLTTRDVGFLAELAEPNYRASLGVICGVMAVADDSQATQGLAQQCRDAFSAPRYFDQRNILGLSSAGPIESGSSGRPRAPMGYSPPIALPLTPFSGQREVLGHEPLPPVRTVSETVGILKGHVLLLADASGIDFDRVLGRVFRLATEGGVILDDSEQERDLRSYLSLIRIQGSFVRPRQERCLRAIQQVAAELLQAGLFKNQVIDPLSRALCPIDPRVFAVDRASANRKFGSPPELQSEDNFASETWVTDVQQLEGDVSVFQSFRGEVTGVVLGESASVQYDGTELGEKFQACAWVGTDVHGQPSEPLPLVNALSHPPNSPEGPLCYRHFPMIGSHSHDGDYIEPSAAAATVFGGLNRRSFEIWDSSVGQLRLIRFYDGHPSAPKRIQGTTYSGWLLVAEEASPADLQALGVQSILCERKRTQNGLHGYQSANARWIEAV
jgi:hypothetical protein